MTDLYRKNLLFFKKRSPVLYKTITSEKPLYETKIEKVQGQFNYILETEKSRCFIHSMYNIERETEKVFEKADKSASALILFGMGAGYYFPYIKKNFPHLKHLVIVEPNLEFFREMLKFIDFRELNSNIKSVMLLINKSPEEAVEFLIGEFKKYLNLGVEIVSNISYRTIYEGYFEFLHKKIIENLRNTIVNTVTLKFISNRDTINFFNNIHNKTLEFEKIASIFKDRPAILVSAGPSLNKNMHLLKDLKDKAIIVAVGSAIKILHNNGIVPHFRVAIDGGENEMKIFEGIDTSNSILLYSNSIYHEILPEYRGPKVSFHLNTMPLEKYLRTKVEENLNTIRSGFSVANVAFDLLCKSGCSKIIIIGQDLCYTGGKNYAKGSWNNDDINLNKKGYIKTFDIFGNEVYTTRPYLGMKNLFERLYKFYSSVPVVNATEGGLNIEGFVNSTLDSETKLLNKIENIQSEIEEINERYNCEGGIAFEKYRDIFSEMIMDFNEVLRISENVIRRIKKLQRYKEKNIAKERTLRELEEINDLGKTYAESEVFLKVILPALHQIIESYGIVYGYRGKDDKKRIDSLEKVSLLVITEIYEYAELIKECLKLNLQHERCVINYKTVSQ